jgi:inorganic pyrophosphatase
MTKTAPSIASATAPRPLPATEEKENAVSNLETLPRNDPETTALLAVIETPRGARNKYKYDSSLNCLRLSKTLPQGMAFPFDFGFIPSTRAEDGDPLDIMILTDESVPPGCVLSVRLIGAIEAEQREGGKEWSRNDRLLGVETNAETHARLHTLDDLETRILDELEAFFVHYNRLLGREFRAIGRVSPQKAQELVDRSAL